jgi:hypothetical protein
MTNLNIITIILSKFTIGITNNITVITKITVINTITIKELFLNKSSFITSPYRERVI